MRSAPRRVVHRRRKAVRTGGPREAGRSHPPIRAAASLRRVQGSEAAALPPEAVGPGRRGRSRTWTGARLLRLPRSGMREEGGAGPPDRARVERTGLGAGAGSAARLARLTVEVRTD